MKLLSQRFLWADVIRVVAIYLVLATHLNYLPHTVNSATIIYFLVFAIYKTCIPLFVMLSGALLLPKKENYKDFFKKRVNRLLAPWIAWSILFLFIEKDYLLRIHDISSFFQAFIATMESFWFLPMILGLYILTPAMRLFVQNSKKRDLGLVIALWFVTVSLLPYHHNSLAFPLQVDDGLLRQVINFFGFYLLGYILTHFKHSGKKYLIADFISVLVGLVWVLIQVLNAKPASQIYIFEYISPGVVFVSTGLFSVMFELLQKYESRAKNWLKSIMGMAGNAALGVYFVHGFVWSLLRFPFHLSTATFSQSFFSTLFVFIFSLVLILLLHRVPYLKKFIS